MELSAAHSQQGECGALLRPQGAQQGLCGNGQGPAWALVLALPATALQTPSILFFWQKNCPVRKGWLSSSETAEDRAEEKNSTNPSTTQHFCSTAPTMQSPLVLLPHHRPAAETGITAPRQRTRKRVWCINGHRFYQREMLRHRSVCPA